MRAVVWTKYGSPDGLKLKEVEKPVPRQDEVLLKIYAATVTMGDCELRCLKFPFFLQLPARMVLGLRKPKRITILGQELAGEIEAVGRDVTRFKKGDQVFAPTLLRLGAYAEYKCLPEKYPVLKPAQMTYEEAATIPTGGINGLYFLRKANIRPGQRVLINGAGGSIGTYAIQIAKSLGAVVTAVDSTEKLEMLRSTGADEVIDYTREDFRSRAERYDAIIDVAGKSPFSRNLKALKPGGRYILGNPSLLDRFRVSWTRMPSQVKVIIATAKYRPEDYAFLLELIESGKIKPIIDRRYPLEQIADAHRYVENGHKKGNVVILVDHKDKS